MLGYLVIIKQLQEEIRICGEYLRQVIEFQTVNNNKITHDNTKNTEPVKSYSNYVVREDIPKVTEYKFTHLTQAIMANNVENSNTPA